MNSKELFLAACGCRPVPRTPVWLMRQVGRYMPGYRKLREEYSFWDLISNAHPAAEATVSILQICDPDALILFSDILTVPAALGAEVSYEPHLTVKAPELSRLADRTDESILAPAYEALRLVAKEHGERKALIGFAGAPYTLLWYLLGDRSEAQKRTLLVTEEKLLREALGKIARCVASHLRAQHEAGASVLQLFDTKAGELSPDMYRTFALEPLLEVLQQLEGADCPVVLFARGANHVLFHHALQGVVLSVDWTVSLSALPDAHARALQGNLDPAVLLAGPEATQRHTERMLKEAEGLGGHIANLGHGVLPDTPVESVQEFVTTAKLYHVTRR